MISRGVAKITRKLNHLPTSPSLLVFHLHPITLRRKPDLSARQTSPCELHFDSSCSLGWWEKLGGKLKGEQEEEAKAVWLICFIWNRLQLWLLSAEVQTTLTLQGAKWSCCIVVCQTWSDDGPPSKWKQKNRYFNSLKTVYLSMRIAKGHIFGSSVWPVCLKQWLEGKVMRTGIVQTSIRRLLFCFSNGSTRHCSSLHCLLDFHACTSPQAVGKKALWGTLSVKVSDCSSSLTFCLSFLCVGTYTAKTFHFGAACDSRRRSRAVCNCRYCLRESCDLFLCNFDTQELMSAKGCTSIILSGKQYIDRSK